MVLAKSKSTDVLNNVFIFYDFKQIKDMIMIVTFIEQSHQWEKIFVFCSNDQWRTELLKGYLNEEKYQWTCEQLKEILKEPETNNGFEEIDMTKLKNEFPVFFKNCPGRLAVLLKFKKSCLKINSSFIFQLTYHNILALLILFKHFKEKKYVFIIYKNSIFSSYYVLFKANL